MQKQVKLVKFAVMHPDYPHKRFSDKRCAYCSLMESLAMDAIAG